MIDPTLSRFDKQLLREHAGQLRAGFREPGPADPYARQPAETLLRESRRKDALAFDWGYWCWIVGCILGLAAFILGLEWRALWG